MSDILMILKKASFLIFDTINKFIGFLKNTEIFNISLFSFFLLFLLLAVISFLWGGDSE